MTPLPPCILFDLDYTLADSSEAIVACIAYALSALGHAPVRAADARATIGLSLPDAYARLIGRTDGEDSARFAALFLAHADQVMVAGTRMLPGAAEVVRTLRDRGHRLGIVTSKRATIVRQVLARERLLDAFEAVVGSEDAPRLKPDPAPLHVALARLGCPPEDALYVGDSVADARAAEAAGVAFCAVLTGVTPREALEAYPARAVLGSVGEMGEDWNKAAWE